MSSYAESAFDPSAGRVGPVQPILHAHGTRRRILSTANEPGRLEVGGGRIVFPMQELQGNIFALEAPVFRSR